MEQQNLKSIVLYELRKAGVSVISLVIIQVICNSLGIGGVGFVTTLYSLALMISNWFSISSTGVVEFGPDFVMDAKTRKTPMAYFTRAGVCAGLMAIGLCSWYIIRILYDLETVVFTNVEQTKTEALLKQISENSGLFLRILYLSFSHLTLYSFCRMWNNMYYSLYAYFLEIKEKSKKLK